MKPSHAASLALLIFSGPAHAGTRIAGGLAVEEPGALTGWVEQASERIRKNRASGPFTECREVKELAGALLCLSDTQKSMNDQWARASMFVEGAAGSRKGVVAKLGSEQHSYAKRKMGGHDLRGADLRRFFEAAERECQLSQEDPAFCLTKEERELKALVDSLSEQRPGQELVLITFAVRGRSPYEEVVTHEILHAQYFLDPKYRRVCDEYWDVALTEEERTAVRAALSPIYDSTDDLLMRNEFQAYMLMEGAEANKLRDFTVAHGLLLQALLTREGLKPLRPASR
jgi:hypothetical protein